MECYEYNNDNTTKIFIDTFNDKIIMVNHDEIEVVDDKADVNKIKNWTKISDKTFIDYYNDVVETIKKQLTL